MSLWLAGRKEKESRARRRRLRITLAVPSGFSSRRGGVDWPRFFAGPAAGEGSCSCRCSCSEGEAVWRDDGMLIGQRSSSSRGSDSVVRVSSESSTVRGAGTDRRHGDECAKSLWLRQL